MATISITSPRSISRLSDEALGEIISYLDPYSQNRVLSLNHRMMAIVIYELYQPWNTVEFLEAFSKSKELTDTATQWQVPLATRSLTSEFGMGSGIQKLKNQPLPVLLKRMVIVAERRKLLTDLNQTNARNWVQSRQISPGGPSLFL